MVTASCMVLAPGVTITQQLVLDLLASLAIGDVEIEIGNTVCAWLDHS